MSSVSERIDHTGACPVIDLTEDEKDSTEAPAGGLPVLKAASSWACSIPEMWNTNPIRRPWLRRLSRPLPHGLPMRWAKSGWCCARPTNCASRAESHSVILPPWRTWRA